MPGYYYYNPRKKKHFTSLTQAVYDELLTGNVNETIFRYGAEEWSHLMRPEWCEANPERTCDLVGLIRTKTRWQLELKLRAGIYRLLTGKKCKKRS